MNHRRIPASSAVAAPMARLSAQARANTSSQGNPDATSPPQLLSLVQETWKPIRHMLSQPSARSRSSYSMEPTAPMRILRPVLIESIERAFVESRFAEPRHAMHVCVHANGKVYVSELALHVSNEGFSVFSMECNGTPERPSYGMPVPETWSRAEFAEWVRSRPDLYATPIIEQLLHKADRKNIRIHLVD